MTKQPSWLRRGAGLLALAVMLQIAACGNDDDDEAVVNNPPVSAFTRSILETDPPSYAALAPVDAAGFELAGRIKPRTVAELRAQGLDSRLMIGGETTDRNFSTFANWKEFLNPLGAGVVRVQSGWNDVEKVIATPAVYDFAKLDEIVDGAVAQQLRPFMFLGYGNTRDGCVDCGGAGLGGAFPKGAGKERFLLFVEATVSRYKDRVDDWQIWNEPMTDLESYKVLSVEVAQAIKRIQPKAKISIGSWYTVHYVLGCVENCNDSAANQRDRAYILESLKYFNDHKGPTVPAQDVYVSFHPYSTNVDYDAKPWDKQSVDNFLALVRGYGFKVRMDENGAPSTPCQTYAMCNGGRLAWTEKNQAKYNLRRVMGDLARDIETSMFTITDLHYNDAKNTKGLLTTGTWDPNDDSVFTNGDQSVKGKKIAFGAFQNVTALFDERTTAVADHGCTVPAGYVAHAWLQKDGSGREHTVLGVWRMTPLPVADTAEPRAVVSISCSRLAWRETQRPLYIDLMDGRTYRMPAAAVGAAAGGGVKVEVPVADWPVLVADPGFVARSLR
ncbi:hypothetical protein [Aquincola sp. J276]|uniref:hypothetical protein n=1 Tax=Aquincola sp. J276 TaxID=2898432 RepID=UPI00215105F0|nr:hypothetical protein [Aquincola sp. J276]MCR5864126.1 hypothetical protein [Aquincola sp. J276]